MPSTHEDQDDSHEEEKLALYAVVFLRGGWLVVVGPVGVGGQLLAELLGSILRVLLVKKVLTLFVFVLH
jgi:hypothetical protein